MAIRSSIGVPCWAKVDGGMVLGTVEAEQVSFRPLQGAASTLTVVPVEDIRPITEVSVRGADFPVMDVDIVVC